LFEWSRNFSTLLSASPTVFGCTAAMATSYAGYHTAYGTALAACSPGVRSASAVLAKNQARENLKFQAKLLSNTINGTATVSDAQKRQLGLNVRAIPQPVPPPAMSPTIDVTAVSGWTASLRLSDGSKPGKRGKPPGVKGVSIFSFVGAQPPTDISAWKFEGSTTKMRQDVLFDNTLAPGTRVFVTAFFFNNKMQSGPACPPVATNLPGSGVWMQAA
jgi:hypothetical protein